MGKLYPTEQQFHWFDMDDTLVEHDPKHGAKVHVTDPTGKRVETLSTSEYNTHIKNKSLKPEHSYDYSEFVDSKVFANSAHPIRKMVNHVQRLLDNGHYVHIITARADMKNPEILLGALKNMGLDTSHPNFHLHRAGNLGKNPTHVNKAHVLNKILSNENINNIKHVFGYDDHPANVTDIHNVPVENSTLAQKFPHIKFHGIHFARSGRQTGFGTVKRVY
jgi:hypothetical protein